MGDRKRNYQRLFAILFALHYFAPVFDRIEVSAFGSTALANSAKRQNFDRKLEFPNYFLPQAYRDLPPQEVPQTVVNESKALLEDALASIFRRMLLPVTLQGTNQIAQVRYFPYIQKILKGVDNETKIYASGGVVRSALSYLYAELYEQTHKNPERSVENILRDIIETNEDTIGFRVGGVGSDFDLLLDGPSEKFESTKAKLLEVTNGPLHKLPTGKDKLSKVGLVEQRSMVLEADINPFHKQTERAQRQGGSTIDYVNFDINQGKFVDPSLYPGTVDDFVRGVSHFAPPVSPDAIEDFADTTLRGLRPMFELPQLNLKDDQLLRENLSKIETQLQEGKKLSGRALGQMFKATRNSIQSGAHNRIYRGLPGSLEAQVLSVSNASRAAKTGYFYPEFADRFPLDHRFTRSDELNGIPESALLPYEQFVAEFTDNGSLYHGTPSIESGAAIFRQGLLMSSDTQGTSIQGRGSYFTKSKTIAEQYINTTGVLVDVRVKNNSKIHVMIFDEAYRQNPAVRAIVDRAKSEKKDPFEVLAREHGIDVILQDRKGHVLVQNADIFEPFHADERNLIESRMRTLLTELNNSKASLHQRTRALMGIANLEGLAISLGAEVRRPPSALVSEITNAFLSEPFRGRSDIEMTGHLTQFKEIRSVVSLLNSDHEREAIEKLIEKKTNFSLAGVRPSQRKRAYEALEMMAAASDEAERYRAKKIESMFEWITPGDPGYGSGRINFDPKYGNNLEHLQQYGNLKGSYPNLEARAGEALLRYYEIDREFGPTEDTKLIHSALQKRLDGDPLARIEFEKWVRSKSLKSEQMSDLTGLLEKTHLDCVMRSLQLELR